MNDNIGATNCIVHARIFDGPTPCPKLAQDIVQSTSKDPRIGPLILPTTARMRTRMIRHLEGDDGTYKKTEIPAIRWSAVSIMNIFKIS